MPLPPAIEVVPPKGPLHARMTVPGSKSETNRALILAAHAPGPLTLRGALWSDDTQVMVGALRALGMSVAVEDDPAEPSNCTIEVSGGGSLGPGGTPEAPLDLYVGNAGTAARFLTAFVALGQGAYRIHGTARMHERPQSALFDALRQLGYDVDAPGDHLPAVVHGTGPRPRRCTVSIGESSQFASALLLSSRQGGWEVEVTDANADESPYVSMTEQMLGVFPESGEYFIEGDTSSGSYFVGADLAARLRGDEREHPVEVANWPSSGWQFDERFALYCDEVVAGRAPEVVSRTTDLGDSIMTAIVLAPLFDRPTRFVDLGRLRVQECDRVEALYEGLTRCGARIEMLGDDLLVHPSRELLHGAAIETYEDHRVAMCFGMLGLFVPGMVIRNPSCVSKTFPDFWTKLAAPMPDGLGATLRDASEGSDGHVLAIGERKD